MRAKLIFYTRFQKILCLFFKYFDFEWNWSQMKQQFRKSFVLIVTTEYQNVRASVNFPPLSIGPGMLPGLCNRPILFVSSRGTPCIIQPVNQLCSTPKYPNHTLSDLIGSQLVQSDSTWPKLTQIDPEHPVGWNK